MFRPLELPCCTVLKNRLLKAAMSDSLGDGRGNPTKAQMRLTALGEDRDGEGSLGMPDAIAAYEARDAERTEIWKRQFGV
mgnify:CR=1 FL=1